jgi:hypothetical protein
MAFNLLIDLSVAEAYPKSIAWQTGSTQLSKVSSILLFLIAGTFRTVIEAASAAYWQK